MKRVLEVAENKMNKEFLFSSHYSLGNSILTLEDESDKEGNEIIDKGPVSIISIARRHKLGHVNLVDDSCSGFIQFYEGCKKYKILPRFGYKVCVCEDINDKSEESLDTESNAIVWVLNSDGYADLVKISTEAATNGFYYNARTDWKTLKRQWSKNLGLSMPFYSSFLARNTTKYKSRCIPDFSFTEPIFHLEGHDLPFDPILRAAAVKFASDNSYKTVESHTCYYYKRADVLKYQIFRCINKRTKTEKPNLEHFASDKFSLEEMLKL